MNMICSIETLTELTKDFTPFRLVMLGISVISLCLYLYLRYKQGTLSDIFSKRINSPFRRQKKHKDKNELTETKETEEDE